MAEDEKPSFWQRVLRFALFVGRSFVRNRCPVRASSLAYTTLLALIPILAVGISISTSLLKSDKAQEQIEQMINTAIDKLAPQLGLKVEEGKDDNRKQIVELVGGSIKTVQSGALGATAGITLVLIAISLLASIESTLNDIWGVVRGRSWLSRVIYYWAVITLGPILLVFALGLVAGPHFETTRMWLESSPVVGFFYNLLPLAVLVFAFAIFYFLMPNTRVEWRAALLGGLVGGGLLHLNSLFSSLYFGQVVRNSKFWGSLGVVPVFLLGLYFSWLILLFGAQVAYAFQNRRSYFQEKQADNINQRGREFVAFRLMSLMAKRFANGARPPTVCEMADLISVPSRLISRTLEPLVQTKLVIEVAAPKDGEIGYAPARPLDKITCQNILDAMRAGIGLEVATKEEPARVLVRQEFDKIRQAEREVASQVTLADLVDTREQGAIPARI